MRATAGHPSLGVARLSTRTIQRPRSVQGSTSTIPTDRYYVGFHRNDDDDDKDRNDQRQQHHYHQKRFHCTLTTTTGLPRQRHPMLSSSMQPLSPYPIRQDNDTGKPTDQVQRPQQQQRRSFHSTPTSERAAAIMLGLASVSALAYAGSSAIQSYQEWKAAQPTPEELEEMRKQEEKEQQRQQQDAAAGASASRDEADRPRENVFRQWFDVGTKYYEGGFEDQMTRREAALILGVRESSSPARIKEAHRKLLVLNHPDTGGSTYMAGKINEAKELLLKGRAK